MPSGSVGKQFIKELTRLFDAYSQRRSALESVALEAIRVACILLLQNPHTTSKCRDHVIALNRRMKAWQEGDIDELLREGRTMQHHLGHTKRKLDLDGEDEDGHTARVFSNLVFEGKIHSALRTDSLSSTRW